MSAGAPNPTEGDEVLGAFSEDHAVQLTNVSQYQLRRWDSIGLLKPSYGAGDTGLPYGRVYSFRDLVSLRVLNQLRNDYRLTISHLSQVQKELAKLSDSPGTLQKLIVVVCCIMPDPQPEPRTQAEKFADLARELECDESEEGFDARLRELARTPTAPSTSEAGRS